jgi:hypothetical protein
LRSWSFKACCQEGWVVLAIHGSERLAGSGDQRETVMLSEVLKVLEVQGG